MLDPLHGGNPHNLLGDQINALLSDATLFRQVPGVSVWVSLIGYLLHAHSSYIDGPTVVVVCAPRAHQAYRHRPHGPRNGNNWLRCPAWYSAVHLREDRQSCVGEGRRQREVVPLRRIHRLQLGGRSVEADLRGVLQGDEGGSDRHAEGRRCGERGVHYIPAREAARAPDARNHVRSRVSVVRGEEGKQRRRGQGVEGSQRRASGQVGVPA